MKKSLILLSAFAVLASVFTGCKKEEPAPQGTQVTFQEALTATDDFYKTWDDERVIPAEVKVGTKTLTISEFLYMEATLLNNIKASTTGDITIVTYKAASNPDRDSYDKEEIAIINGEADTKGYTEDVATIASRILEAAAEKSQMPNQTVINRGSGLAFSTNRAIVTIARAVNTYVSTGKLDGKISTEYQALTATLKAFAEQFVGYLDVWEANVCGKLSADGKRCEDKGTALENVHFVPIPQDTPNDWTKQGEQWDAKYQPYKTVTVDGTTYTAANCWEIAIRGLMDLCTSEGSDFLATMDKRSKLYTLANGKSFASAPIRTPSENCIWGKYPWYEKDNENSLVTYNGEDIKEVGLEFILRCGSWHVVRAFYGDGDNGKGPLGMIGNFQQFGTTPTSTLVLDGYEGLISPMREFLVLARIYKYMLDNDVNANVYDAIKDVKVDFDLYNQAPIPVVLKTDKLSFDAKPAEAQNAEFTTTGAWTATPSESWIHVNPASGVAGTVSVAVTADENTVTEAREGKITVAVGEYSKEITIKQAAKEVVTDATIKEFIQEYVKIIDIWKNTTGKINMMTGEAQGEAQFDVENAHYIPETTTITVKGKTYNTADMLETAERCYLLMRGYDGNWTGGYGAANYESHKLAGSTMSGTTVPATHSYVWAASPYNETGTTSPGNVVSGNGGYFKMGDPQVCNGVDSAKVDVLDNFAMRHTNWPITKGAISNLCGYAAGQVTGYYGCFSAKRALISYAFFFKYMLDNSLEDATAIAATQTFKCDLFGLNDKVTTIKDFATEYVKILDVWANNTGTINFLTGEAAGKPENDNTNAHYVPETTTITVAGKTYNTADMLETAERCYLLLRGYDGNWTGGYGAANYESHKLAGSTMSGTEVPATHDYVWGASPYNESGTTSAGNVTSGNGGFLKMGDPQVCDGVDKVKVDILDNFAMRHTNWPITKGSISNMCGYASGQLAGYYGCFSAKRALVTYAKFFKYMLDNSVEDATTIEATTQFDTILF